MIAQSSLFRADAPVAIFSACDEHGGLCAKEDCVGRRYRYELWWPTGEGKGSAAWCLANPSTASHLETDRTVARCIDYSRRWGFAWAGIANARAWRETDPDLVPADPLAVGPDNDRHIAAMVKRADVVIVGYGKLGGVRGPEVLRIIREAGKVPHALKLNADRSPCHPLYLRADLKPFPMEDP